MKEIVNKLHECGENVEIKRGHIHVKFPLFMSNLVIKKDIATNQLMFAYNQIGDLFSIVLFCLLAGNFIAKGEYIFVFSFFLSAGSISRVHPSTFSMTGLGNSPAGHGRGERLQSNASKVLNLFIVKSDVLGDGESAGENDLIINLYENGVVACRFELKTVDVVD